MAKVTGDGISLSDLEEIVGGNTDDAGLRYDPAEDGFTFIDKDTDEPILTVRQNGEVVIPIEANVESIDITQLSNDLDVDNFDLNNIGTIRANTSDVGTFIGDLLDLTDADIDKLVSNLSANGYDINAIGTASADTVSASNISGTVTDGQGDVTRLPGAGLSVENGDLVVTASFSGISGISNPLTADLNADGFDIQNVNRANVEELTDDEPIDLVGTSFERAGHDEVDVPQVRNLTVEDWESGTLDTDVWEGDTGEFSVVSDPTGSGKGYVLQANSISTTYKINSSDGLSAYPQFSDRYSAEIYLTSTGDRHSIRFNTGIGTDDHRVTLNASNNVIQSQNSEGVAKSVSASLTDHINEWLTLNFSIQNNGTFTLEIPELSITLEDTILNPIESIGLSANDVNSNSQAFFNLLKVERRSPEYFSDTQKGTTKLGNEVTPSGAIHTGPLESSTNALRQEYATAPVNSDATQGDTSLLTLLKSGVNPAMYMERTMDGQGGAYGHQLQAALGRFSRINANLSWEYDTLADVPTWNSADGGTSVWTFDLTDFPRRIHVEHDGSAGSFDRGGVKSSALVSVDSFDGFSVTFEDVSASNNNLDSNYLNVGLTDQPVDSNVSTGNGVFYETQGIDALVEVESGARNGRGLNPEVDWSINHDVTIEYDGDDVRLYIDGLFEAEHTSYTGSGSLSPFIQLADDGDGDGTGEIVEVQQITVEPLPEVLQ